MTRDDYVNMLKNLLLDNAVDSAFTYIVSKVTWLAWGPLGPIVKKILEKILIVFMDHTELAVFLLYTDFRLSRQGRKFTEAAERNYNAQRNGSEQDKLEAEKNLKNSFREFVKLTN